MALLHFSNDTKFWFGDKSEELVQVGWFNAISSERTHAVGGLKANPLGLFDTHGNVWEWVEDVWEPTQHKPGEDKPAINPNETSSTDVRRVLRGGCWFDPADLCRSSFRYAYKPTTHGYSFGFRVALPVDAVKQSLQRGSLASGTLDELFPDAAKLSKDLAALVKRVRENKRTDPLHADLVKLRQELLDYKVAHAGKPEAELVSKLFPFLPQPAAAPQAFRNIRVGVHPKADKPLELPAVAKIEHPPLSRSALVQRPAKLPGVKSWSVETEAHRGAVWGVAFSPTDEHLLASACDDGLVRLWNAQTGQLLRILVGHDEAVRDVVWSPDGKLLASGSEDGTVRVWEPTSGRLIKTLNDAGGGIFDLDWSHDGQHLAVATFDRTLIWKTENWQREKEIAAGKVIAWSADDSLLATSGGYKTTRVWNATSGELHAELVVPEEKGSYSDLVIWSPTGRTLLVGGQVSGSGIEFWDVDEKKILKAFPGMNVGDVAWASDGTNVFTVGELGNVGVWNYATGERVD